MCYEYDEWEEIRHDYYEDRQEMYEAEYGEDGDGTMTYEDYSMACEYEYEWY